MAEDRLAGFRGAFFVNSARTCDPNCTQRMAVLDDWNAARLWKIAEPDDSALPFFT